MLFNCLLIMKKIMTRLLIMENNEMLEESGCRMMRKVPKEWEGTYL